jgi:nitroreductase
MAELESIGEAFRWAPSSSNQQPWKLVLLTRGSELFESIASTGLTGFNQTWAPDASALAVVLAAKTFEGKERKMAETYFDVGLASSQLVTQVESMGLKAHFMGGIVPEKITELLNVSEHAVICVIAIGKQGSTEGQEDAIVARERAPRTRNSSSDVYLIDATL